MYFFFQKIEVGSLELKKDLKWGICGAKTGLSKKKRGVLMAAHTCITLQVNDPPGLDHNG